MARKQIKSVCPNCGAEATCVFHSVPCCGNCHKIASTYYTRAVEKVNAVLRFQRERLTVLLAEGRLHLTNEADLQIENNHRVPASVSELLGGPEDDGRGESGSG